MEEVDVLALSLVAYESLTVAETILKVKRFPFVEERVGEGIAVESVDDDCVERIFVNVFSAEYNGIVGCCAKDVG